MSTNSSRLGLFTLISINITAVLSLSSIAYMATIGVQSVVFFALAAIMFFIPSALISAELSGMMPNNNGGVYTWVSSAFGNNTGLVAIWMEWFNNNIGFPATLSAIVATSAYLGYPQFASNPIIMFGLMLVIMWAISLFNCLPIRSVAILNIVGATFGMVLPGVLIIICALYWLFLGHSQLNIVSWHSFVPVLSFSTFALFVKVLSSYSGIQAVSFYTTSVKRPRLTIPLSMLLSVMVILGLTVVATLALASIIPPEQVNAMNGLIEGISFVLSKFHLVWLSDIITMCICIGMIASLSTWVLGPAKAMQEVARRGLIPRVFAKSNRYHMPVNVLIVQAILCSLLALVFIFLPSIEEGFAILIALTSQFTVFMFILIFSSAIRLRYTQPHLERAFRIGKLGNNVWLIFWSVLGIVSCSCGFVLGLYPPKFVHASSIGQYISFMLIADIVIILIPFSYILYRKKMVSPK